MSTLEQSTRPTTVQYFYCDAVQLYILELQHQQITHIVQAPSVSRLKALFRALLQEQALSEDQFRLEQVFIESPQNAPVH